MTYLEGLRREMGFISITYLEGLRRETGFMTMTYIEGRYVVVSLYYC